MTVYRRPDPIPRRASETQPAASSPLEAVRPEADDLSQLVARKIFAAIASGHFAEGSILPNEHALGETLGVSRTALREAIKGLSSKGMLETRRRRGTQVTDRSQWTFVDGEVIAWSRKGESGRISEELWQVLSLIMPDLARLAAASPERASLGRAQREGWEQKEAGALAVSTLLTEIARLSGNRFLASMASISLISLVRDDRPYVDARLGAVPLASLDAIRRAVATGDGAASAEAMRAVLADARTQPVAAFREMAR